jgi:hypothetical protein
VTIVHEPLNVIGEPNEGTVFWPGEPVKLPEGWHVYSVLSDGRPVVVRAAAGTPLPKGFRLVSGRASLALHRWAWFSPPHLTEEEEAEIGTRTPSSEHTVAVVRETSEGGRYTASAGLGTHTRNLRGSFESVEVATAAAVAEVKRLRAAFVAHVIEARGGPERAALWGLQFPAEVPIEVRYPKRGESAWDAKTQEAVVQDINAKAAALDAAGLGKIP